MNFSEEQIKNINDALAQLKQSSIFGNSERNYRILSFLVDSYLKQVHVKESILEIELFGDKDNSISYDGKVRVYMYNLRKKLEEYYRTDGAKAKIKFIVKKGQYNLSIEEQNTNEKSNSAKNTKLPYYIIIALAIALIALIYPKTEKYFEETYCWTPFFDKEATSCCVGDHFMVIGKTPNGKRSTQYLNEVNSNKDFDNLLKSDNPDREGLTKAPFSFVTKMGPVSTARLSQWFTNHNKKLSVVMESEISPDIITRNNVVYIGPFRTMDFFSTMFLNNSKVFSYDGKDIILKKTGSKIRNMHVKNSREDHVMVSFNKMGNSGLDIIYFAGNNDIGVMAAVKNFTNKAWLKRFYKELPNTKTYFNALFKVDGIGRTELSCELIEIELL